MTRPVEDDTRNKNPRPFECSVRVCQAEEGGFYAFIANLPGVVSEGETVDETLENIAAAFREAIASYRDAGEAVPWTSPGADRDAEGSEYRIVVDA